MLGSRIRTHLNQDHSAGVSFFKQVENLYILLLVHDIQNVEDLEKYCDLLSEAITKSHYSNATEFDVTVSDAFRTANLPLVFSISCLSIKDNLVYLKTYGTGAITLKRKGKQVTLVKSGTFASGMIEQGDKFVLCFGEHDPFIDQDNTVLIEFGVEEQEEIQVAEEDQPYNPTPNFSKPLLSGWLNSAFSKLTGRRKSFVIVAFLCLLIFMYLFLKSYNSKSAQEDRDNIEYASTTIAQNLEQAEDVFELNAGRSIALLAESKKDLKELENKLHSKHKTEVTSLLDLINKTEKKILQKNIKSSEEFIDLGLEEKGATGTVMWRYEDRVVIINPKGEVYILSLDKKSLEARSSKALSGISLSGLDDQVVYAYKSGKGIIKIESDTSKPATVIKQDKEWGTITDLQVYNKNLYLLDSGKGQIYKYIPTEDGFATKSAYFKSGAYTQSANSFAIDQSVYVAQKNLITKYTSGLQDGFAPQYPDSQPNITRIVTGGDVEDLYIWDKNAGRIVVLSKNGDYRKTVESSILSKATSVEVFSDNAYALLGSKIFKVSLK